MKSLRVVCFAIAVCACGEDGPTTPTPTPAVDLKTALSASFDAMSMPANAACSISISRYGQVVLERGRGQVAPGVAASADSLFRIASLTKPITASAVLISEKVGRMSRTDKINKFLPFAEPAPTIDELIKHVPGLFDYLTTPAYQSGNSSPTTVENLLSLLQPWDGIKRYQYSNSHAVLSGAALQQANGIPYEEIVQRDIFGPVGMTRSSFTIPSPSESSGVPFPSTTHPSWVFSAGGITSTVSDMNRFNQALLSNFFGFGTVESFDRSAAGVTSFAMGSGSPNGDLRFTHSGLLNSYSSFTALFPADRASIVLLCNYPTTAHGTFLLGPGGIRSIMLGTQ
jgi:CubicO group peptidase (beta-lactamase class C family)